MKFKLFSSTLAATVALLVSPIVLAQDVVPLEFPQELNFVGLGLFAVPDYYGSQDYQGAVAPIVRYTFGGKRYVQLLGPELTLNLVDRTDVRAGLVLRSRARRDDDVDDEVVQRMRPIASATELGLFAAYHMPLDVNRPLHKVVFSGDVMGNTNDVYDGATGNLRVNYVHPFQKTMGGRPIIGNIGIGMFFASSSFNRKYFGVVGTDLDLFARLGGQEYQPDSGVTSVKIPFSLTTLVDKKWLLSLAGRYERLLGDAKDSPVVDRRGDANQWMLGVAFAYIF
ncbi:MAG: MipA/OmpV family protein [Pseudomonadota bacterium]